MWKRKMKIKWNKKKLKRNCGWEEGEKVNHVKEKNENKMKEKETKKELWLRRGRKSKWCEREKWK